MRSTQRKIAVIGCGLVGTAAAYSIVMRGYCDTLVFIDTNTKKAAGEAADMSHALPFMEKNIDIYQGDYSDLRDADAVIITAGASQRVGESRIDLLSRNSQIFTGIIKSLNSSGFSGIIIVAVNPVDILTRLTCEMSVLPKSNIIGTGTMLDTARLRLLLGRFFNIDPKNIHACVMGEHGESEFVPRTQATVATKRVTDIIRDSGGKYTLDDLNAIENQVRDSASLIISSKGATCWGIGSCISRLLEAVLSDERSIFTLSLPVNGSYGISGNVCCGVPAVIGRDGVIEIVELALDRSELDRLRTSCAYLDGLYRSLKVPT